MRGVPHFHGEPLPAQVRIALRPRLGDKPQQRPRGIRTAQERNCIGQRRHIGPLVRLAPVAATVDIGAAGPRQVDGARLALAENGGGFQGYEEAVAAITILARP